MRARLTGVVLVSALGALSCGKRTDGSAPAEQAEAKVAQARPDSSGDGAVAPVGSPAGSASAEAVLADAPRKAYSAVDMRVDPCIKVGEDGVIHGRRCETVFSVFGPYVAAPEKSEVEVSFKIESSMPISVFGDMVSELGRQFHGGILPQDIPAKERRSVGYRINMAHGAKALETRIGVRGKGAVDFDIHDLAIVVR